MNMDKYIIYARKSSEAEDRQVLSIESQLKELQEVAKKLKLNVVEVIVEAKSAKEPGRDGFQDLIQKLESQIGNAILTWHPDRLSRNAKDSAEIIDLFDRNKLRAVQTPSQLFRVNPMDKFMLGFFMMNAKLENDTKGVNVKRGLNTKAERGWLPSGAKAGYMNDKYAEKGNKTILVDPERFPLIRKAWDCMLTQTYTVMDILRLLNEEWGYRTPQHKKIGGKPMSRSQLYKTFTDPFYYGEFEYPVGSGQMHNGKHTPMITREEFDRVQRFLGRKGRPQPRSTIFEYTGLIKCGECKASITAEEKYQIICSTCRHKFSYLNKECCPKCKTELVKMTDPTRLHYVYYHCTKRKDPSCTQGSIEVKLLEEKLDKLLLRIQISERFKTWAIKYLNELNDAEVEDRKVIYKSIQEAIDDCNKRLDNLIKLKISPNNVNGELISDEEFRKQKETIIKERDSWMAKLNDSNYSQEKWIETAEKTFDFACHARYWFANGNRQTKREILASLSSNIIIRDKNVLVDLVKPLQFIEMTLNEEPSISEMFEPAKEVDSTLQLEALWAKNSNLLPR